MIGLLRRLWWRLTWRLRTPCTTWPCKRCNRAGRTSWRSRKRWHTERRVRRLRIARRLLVAVVIVAGAAWAGVAR